MKKWSLASALIASVLLLGTLRGQSRPAVDSVPGELLVKFTSATPASQRVGILAARRATRLRRFETLGVEHVRIQAGLSVEDAVAAFRQIPGVELVQPNYRRHAIQNPPPPNDPFWLDGSLWGLAKIQAQAAWTNFTPGDGSVVIAGIDTGIDYTHPDLAPNMWRNPGEIPANGIDDDGDGYIDDVYGIDTVNHDSDPMDDQGHGTHTAGTLAAAGNNAIGVTGVNWNAQLLACKFLDASGSGDDAGAIECFNYITMLKNRGVNIRVSSNSWGEARGSGPPSSVLQAAIDAAGAAGIVNVFGAGNDSSDNDLAPFDPASYDSPSIIAVASSGSTDDPSYFTNFGAVSVDLAAPGEDILSTYPGNDYEYLSGTSMATPHVAGAAALLASLDPTLSVAAIKALLLANVDPVPNLAGMVASGGRLNVYRAAVATGVVSSNSPPTVALTSPFEGATFKAPALIQVTAAASDSDGTIRDVSFFANGALIGTSSASPYGVAWANNTPGAYTLTAVATDDHFATTTSTPVHVLVLANVPPAVSIASPAEGATFTSPATVTIQAAASDSDGTVMSVVFYADGNPIGTVGASPFSLAWNAPVGSHTLTAVATDDSSASTTSGPVHITVNPLPGRLNVALASNGGAASASSVLGAGYGPSGAINGDRKGVNFGNGGGWNDGTQNAFPDWIEVDFTGMKFVEEVDLFSMQDNYSAPVDPTPTMTFASFGVRGFQVQYWDGAQWVAAPGGTVTDNNLVWRTVAFWPLTTNKIRVSVTAGLNGYSRVMEVEAWGVASSANAPPDVSITSPADSAVLVGPSPVTIAAAAHDSDGSVASVEFFANGTSIGASTASPFAVTWSNASPGTYTLTAVATDNQGATSTSAPVHVTVVQNTPPSVTLTSPADASSYSAPVTLSVTATAADSDGTIASVAFFANGAAIGTAATAPYGVTWSNVAAGTYTLTAVATDNLGATSTSAPVHVTVNAVPGRMNMALASNGGAASASSVLGAGYGASGAINGDRKGLNFGSGGGWNDGTANTFPDWLEVDFAGYKIIDEVDVFSMQDNYSAPVDPTPTMTFSYYGLRAFDVQYWTGTAWADVTNGSIANNSLVWRQLTFPSVTTTKIRLLVSNGLNGYSRVMELEAWGVPSTLNAPPDVSLTSPIDGSTFTAPATVSLAASAHDSDGAVQQVAFFANGAPIGTAAASPYVITWSGAAQGTYTLTAVATDNQGATTTSAPVHVTVAANNPPAVTITTPVNGAAYSAPATLTVGASASDSDGSVQQVVFFANGSPIGTSTASPYSVTWSNIAAGTYALTATATDNLGATTTSAAVTVTVNAVPGRMNVALAANGGVASASSVLGAGYPASAAINGDRKGVNFGNGGGWNDGTSNTYPDWLEVDFAGYKTINEVDVFSMQDVYWAPADPTPTMTFTSFGLRAFEIQYWTGSAWVDVPGGSIANNNLVWRQLTFSPLTTTKVRILISSALNGYSRVMELEAWGVSSGINAPPDVSISSPADASTFIAPATVTVSAAAHDSDGTIQQVAFLANGVPIGQSTTSPYSISWTNVAAGSYTLTAVATDNQGASTTSAPVHVTVATNNPPTVAISSPVTGAAFNAPAVIPISATAADSDGTIRQVAFFANGAPIGTSTTSPYSISWGNVAAGSYTLTAVATDNVGATTTSAPVQVTVNVVPGRLNMALAANGGVATASSSYSGNYGPSGAINGDRKGLNFGAGGGWNDGTANTFPDWIEVDFAGAKAIDEVDVFSMQDNYSSPVEPTPTMTFSYYGLKAFEVQYWNGSAWVDVPNGAIIGNSLVWRQVSFSAVTTTKIRLLISSALSSYSRVMELEAWGVAAQEPESAATIGRAAPSKEIER